MRDHVEEDVVVEHGCQAGFGAALDGDQAVFQLVADDTGIRALAEREGGNIHQVDVVLDRRVIDGRHEEGQLCIFRRGRAQDALGLALLHHDGCNIGLQAFNADGFAEIADCACDRAIVILDLVELEVGPDAAAVIAPQAAQRILVQLTLVASRP